MRKSIILHKQDVLPLSIVWQCQQKPPATEKCLQSLSELWWSTGHRCAGINHQLWLSPRLPALPELPYSWRENSQLSIFVHIITITHPPIAVVMSKPLSWCWCNYRVSCFCCSPPAQSLSIAAAASSFSIQIFTYLSHIRCLHTFNCFVNFDSICMTSTKLHK